MTGRHDYPELVALVPPSRPDPLVEMAQRAQPLSRTHRAKWLKAVKFLRKRNLWVLDKDARAPQWRASEEIA
jgi:hypothetical protein